MLKIACLVLIFLLSLVLFTSASDQPKTTLNRVNNFLHDILWVKKITRGYFASEISKEHMVLFLEQKIAKRFKNENPDFVYKKTAEKYKTQIEKMISSVKKDKWTLLYKQYRALNEIENSFVDAFLEELVKANK